nr:MAG TPA: DNA polymerase III, alpha subunit [Caudoviricetes sp.]
MEVLGILKFDILGLKTMSEIKELEGYTNKVLEPDDIYEDSEIFEAFKQGNTDGIFQFESPTVRKIFDAIECDCFEDVCAANAMNRPGPLSLGTPQQYAENKQNLDDVKKSVFYEQTKNTYGTVVYQEQIMRICMEVANMTADQADKMMKLVKDQESRNRLLSGQGEVEKDLHDSFLTGCMKAHIPGSEAEEMFNDMATYSFNMGHAYGYSVIACFLMWYKLNYPEYFWLVKLKYASKENFPKYRRFAVRQGSIILTPHVNGTAKFSVSTKYGDICLQEGLSNIDGIGEKVAASIEEERNRNGDFENYKDFQERMPKRIANIKVFNALEKAGALEFNEKKYMQRVKEYNLRLYAKG